MVAVASNPSKPSEKSTKSNLKKTLNVTIINAWMFCFANWVKVMYIKVLPHKEELF